MKRVVYGMLLASATLSAPAQVGVPPQEGAPSVSTASVPLTYTGGDSRVSVGVDKDGHTDGELLGVFGNNGEHAIVAQIWWAHGGAGGVQADYNWLWGTTLDEVRRDPDAATVAKLSFAIDQNADKDRQANIGFAIERKEFFLNFFLSGKASGARGSGSIIDQHETQQSGTDVTGIYTQTQTDIATTLLESQPYSYTVGMHGGHFSDALTARFNGGFDYARGHDGAKQNRISLGVDKYLGTHGWSVSALAEHTQSDDPVRDSRSDNRWWLFLRYEFGGGGAFRPQQDGDTAAAAWIQRALRNPVTGHPRTVQTYVSRGKTTTKTVVGPKQYTARRPVLRDDTATVAENSSANAIDVLANDSDPDGNALAITAVTAPASGTAQIAGGHVTYTPTAGFAGNDAFAYTVTNAKGLAASANVAITVTATPPPPPPTSGPPIARDDLATTANATPVVVAVLANDSDPGNYALTVVSVTAPGHGTSQINPGGTVTYTPVQGYDGPDRFTYSIDNGHGGTASASVIITVRPQPAALPPVARDDSASTPYATPVAIYVLDNDTSPAGYFLAVTSAGVAAHGSTHIDPGGTITYTPLQGFVGTDSFSYSISDGHGGFAGATVTVTVVQPGGSFIAQNDTAVTAYATAIAINVLANDQAPTGFTLTLKSVSTPAHGTAQIGGNGIVTYTPSPGFNGGVDAFSYAVSDGPDTTTALVTVTVQPPGAPVAQNDSSNTAFNTPVAINVLGNDSDPSGFALGVSQVTVPAHGTAQINPDNTVTYTPQHNYTGADSFSYTIGNGHGGTATGNVSVTVGPAPPPVARDDGATTPFNKPVAIDVLGNDADPNALPLSVSQVGTPAHGSAQISANSIIYTPASNYSGNDSFSYTASNGHGGTASATVSVTVQPVLPPVAVDDTPTTAFKTPVTINVLQNDSDPNGLPLSVISINGPVHPAATAVINPDKTITYTPDPELISPDSFTYTISNGFLQATATVSITVQAPPPPVAADDLAQIPYNPGMAIDIPVLDNDSSATGFLQITQVGSASHGTVGNQVGHVTYKPGTFVPAPPWAASPLPFAGSDSFTYTVFDGFKYATATVHVTVQLPPPPVAADDSGDVERDGAFVSIAVVANDSHPTDYPVYVVNVSPPASDPANQSPGATTLLEGDHVTVTYTSADPSFLGDTDTFTYTIADPYGQTSGATVHITNIGP